MSGEAQPGFQARSVSLAGRDFPYSLYVPPGYRPLEPWPLILFLHGAAERGSDGRKQTQVGLGPVLLDSPNLYPAFVVLPQCPEGSRWQGKPLAAAMAAVDQVR